MKFWTINVIHLKTKLCIPNEICIYFKTLFKNILRWSTKQQMKITKFSLLYELTYNQIYMKVNRFRLFRHNCIDTTAWPESQGIVIQISYIDKILRKKAELQKKIQLK